ncbi:uncharacterized protein METZ01_LOCUS362532, partial [marine metagenome]
VGFGRHGQAESKAVEPVDRAIQIEPAAIGYPTIDSVVSPTAAAKNARFS